MSPSSSDRPPMRAVRLRGAGELDALACETTDRPEPHADEVVVEVRATAVNRSDVLNARGLLPITTFPVTPGRDFAGVVVEGPSDLIGREVWGAGGGDLGFRRDGAHAEYITVPSEGIAEKPGAWSMEEAGSCGL